MKKHGCEEMKETQIVKKNRIKIGIINPWPGTICAESELTLRIKKGIENTGAIAVCLDNFGHVLDTDLNATSEVMDGKELEFVITTHYETHKSMDSFYYHALWNPPEIPLNVEDYCGHVANNYLMNDDYLIHNKGVMKNHLKSILLNKNRTLEGASSLTTSFPMTEMLSPKLDNPMMFYCGMNWEVLNGTNRHAGLFRLLDETEKVRFYGPDVVKAWGGIRPWAGYKCYQHEIPFDGFSILKEINECGVCLALSSDIHRRSGMATNRVYEACTAGAVIISDENPFMVEHFKDAALFINYNKNNPQDTFSQIMEKFDWILKNKTEALRLARKAQKIFAEKFALEVQIKSIIDNHKNRFKQISEDVFAIDDTKKVLVTYVLNTLQKKQIDDYLNPILDNISNQVYKNIELALAVDKRVVKQVESICKVREVNFKVYAMDLFDKKESKALTDGQAICKIINESQYDYFLNTNSKEIWFYDHITTLVRTVEDDNASYVYSGSLYEDMNLYRSVFFFGIAQRKELYDAMEYSDKFRVPGQFMFTKEAMELIPDFLYDGLDGKEHYALTNLLKYRYQKTGCFSRRMTFVFLQDGTDERNIILSDERQTRFIKDSVRFYIPEQTVLESRASVESTSNVRELADKFQTFPIKTWLKIRYYQMKLRKVKSGSKKEKKYLKKMQEIKQLYNQYFGI